MSEVATKPQFLTIEGWKSKLGIASAEVIRNPNTQKLFVAATLENGNVQYFNCEQSINPELPRRMMLPIDKQDDATAWCLINVPDSNNVQFSL